jgi:hypothetical protein
VAWKWARVTGSLQLAGDWPYTDYKGENSTSGLAFPHFPFRFRIVDEPQKVVALTISGIYGEIPGRLS